MSMTDRSNKNISSGVSTKRTPDRRYGYRKFVYSLLNGSVQDMKKGGKTERAAIVWLASDGAKEIYEDMEMNTKDILKTLKNILLKEDLEKKFYIKKLENIINETFEDCRDE